MITHQYKPIPITACMHTDKEGKTAFLSIMASGRKKLATLVMDGLPKVTPLGPVPSGVNYELTDGEVGGWVGLTQGHATRSARGEVRADGWGGRQVGGAYPRSCHSALYHPG